MFRSRSWSRDLKKVLTTTMNILYVEFAGRVLRKTGLTTSRSGELTLSDAEETMKRRSADEQQDPIRFRFTFTSPGASTPRSAADKTTVPGPILTVNSVANPAAAQRVDAAPTAAQPVSGVTSRRQTAATSTATASERLRTPSTSSEQQQQRQRRRYSFDDEQFDWSDTLNLLSRLDDGQSSSGQRKRPVDSERRERREDVRSTTTTRQRQPVNIHVERSRDWTATLPAHTRDKPPAPSTDTSGDTWRLRNLSAQHGYSSDSEISGDWLERQRRRLRQRAPSTGSTPNDGTSTMKARIVFPPPRTELERRLVDELRTSQERLNLVDKSSSYHDARNGLYSSSTLPVRSSHSSLPRGRSLTNGFYEQTTQSADNWRAGSYSTLPAGRPSRHGGDVHRAASDLNFNDDWSRRGYNDDVGGFDKHRSLTSLRGGGDSMVEQRRSLVRTHVTRHAGKHYTPVYDNQDNIH